MPIIGSFGVASSRGFGEFLALGGGFPSGYYLGSIGSNDGASSFTSTAIKLDSSNNIYLNGGFSFDTTGCYANNSTIFKLNSSLTAVWRKMWSDPSADLTDLAYYNSTNQLTTNFVISGRYDYAYVIDASTPAKSFTRYIDKATTYGSTGWTTNYSHMNFDSSGNVYSIGSTNRNVSCCNTSFYGTVTKYNSSGTYQWSRSLAGDNDYRFFSNMVVNPSTGYLTVGATVGSYNGFYTFDTSGNFVWGTGYFLIGGNNQAGYITVDSSGNYYGIMGNGGIVKANSSGTFQWYVYLTSSRLYIRDTVKISGTSMYTLGTYNNTIVISKFDISGSTPTLSWSNKWTPTVGNVAGGGTLTNSNQLEIDSTGKLWFSCRYDNGARRVNLFGSVPADGTGTSASKSYTFIGTTWKYEARSDTTSVTTSISSTSFSAWSTINPTQNTPSSTLLTAANTPQAVSSLALT